MTADAEPTGAERGTDLDLYTIGTDIPGGEAVLLVTENDMPDDVLLGRWTTEEEVAKIWDGDVYIRLRRAGDTTVDAELVLSHDGHLMPVVRLRAVDWAEQLRVPVAAVMALHTDLESGEPCKAHADGVIPGR